MFTVFGIILLCLGILIAIRNTRVYEERVKTCRLILKLNLKDIDDGKEPKEYNWRWEEYSKYTYIEMLFTIWKPVKSFYKGKFEGVN